MTKTMLAMLAAVTLGAPAPAIADEPLDAKGRPTIEPEMRGETRGAIEPMSMDDQTFMRKATEAGIAEMKMAKLALQKSKSDETKRFAQKILDDHMKANDELKKIADKRGMTLPSDPDPVQKATLERLSKLSGEEFDRAFMDENLRAHEDATRLFRNEATMSKDPELKAFASRTLPTLREHGDMARRSNERKHM